MAAGVRPRGSHHLSTSVNNGDLGTNPHGLCIGSVPLFFSIWAQGQRGLALGPRGGAAGRDMPISGGGGQPKSWSSRASEKGRSRSPRQTCDVSERGNRKTWHCYGGPSLGEIHIACEPGVSRRVRRSLISGPLVMLSRKTCCAVKEELDYCLLCKCPRTTPEICQCRSVTHESRQLIPLQQAAATAVVDLSRWSRLKQRPAWLP